MLSSILQMRKLRLRNFNHLSIVTRANNQLHMDLLLSSTPSRLLDPRRRDPALSQDRNLGTYEALNKYLLSK